MEAAIDLERDLENWVEKHLELLEPDLALLARQLDLGRSGTLDLLCLDARGRLVVVELKKGEAYRDTLAQVLDYTARVAAMTYEDLEKCVNENRLARGYSGGLADVLEKHLGAEQWTPETGEPRMLIAGSGADESLRGIVEFLERYEVPVNGVFFDVYAAPGGGKLLVRSGIVTDERAASQGKGGRGRWATTHAAVLAFAEHQGTKHLVEPVCSAWAAATGRPARPESTNTWTLQSTTDARSTAARLWPKSVVDGKKAWLEVYVPTIARDLGQSEDEIKTGFQQAGIALEGEWIDLSTPEAVERVEQWIAGSYGSRTAKAA